MFLRVLRVVLVLALVPVWLPYLLLRRLFPRKRLPVLEPPDAEGRVAPFGADLPVALRLTDWTPVPTAPGEPLCFTRPGEGTVQLSRKQLTGPLELRRAVVEKMLLEPMRGQGSAGALEEQRLASGLVALVVEGRVEDKRFYVALVQHDLGALMLSWTGQEDEAGGLRLAREVALSAAPTAAGALIDAATAQALETMMGGDNLATFASLRLLSERELARFPGVLSRPFAADLHLLFVACSSPNSNQQLPVTAAHLERAGLTADAFFTAALENCRVDDLKIEREGAVVRNTRFTTSMACFVDPEAVRRVEAELGRRWVIAFSTTTRFAAAADSPSGRAAVQELLEEPSLAFFDRPSSSLYLVDAARWTRLG